jgi:hypothetical protein
VSHISKKLGALSRKKRTNIQKIIKECASHVVVCAVQKITILFSQTAELVAEQNGLFTGPYQMTQQTK